MVFAIYGYTGQGIETAGEILSEVLRAEGIRFRSWRDFSTVIRGGLTAFELYIDDVDFVSEAPVRSSFVDVAVVWDDEALTYYGKTIKDLTNVYGSEFATKVPVDNRRRCPRIGFNVWALGVLSGLLGIAYERVESRVLSKFPGEQTIALLKDGFVRSKKEHFVAVDRRETNSLTIISGNDALCIGALAGGVRFYCGYPITPASDILERLAKWLPPIGGVAYQVEDEIAAIHMAVGASYAGARTFVATSGPGLSLMTEGLGYCATIEVPLVIIDNQRGGPSTGMPTKTEQSDLFHLVYGGHGEFAKIVLAPTGVLDCISVMQEALNLADIYQCPVLLALDLDLALRRISVSWQEIDELVSRTPVDRGRTVFEALPEAIPYRRYADTDNGGPWRTVPGIKGGAYVASGDEHDERGWMEPDYKHVRQTLHLRRLHKTQEIQYNRPITQVGAPSAPVVLIGTGAMSELIAATVRKEPDKYRGILLRQLVPLPKAPVGDSLSSAKKVVIAEYNATGQLEALLAPVLKGYSVSSLRRFDGEHYTYEEFTGALKKTLDNGVMEI